MPDTHPDATFHVSTDGDLWSPGMQPEDMAMVARGLEAQGEFGQAGELWAQAGEPGQAARCFLKVSTVRCCLWTLALQDVMISSRMAMTCTRVRSHWGLVRLRMNMGPCVHADAAFQMFTALLDALHSQSCLSYERPWLYAPQKRISAQTGPVLVCRTWP